jgi:hypothetical protein
MLVHLFENWRKLASYVTKCFVIELIACDEFYNKDFILNLLSFSFVRIETPMNGGKPSRKYVVSLTGRSQV